jgi:hypothetical protein
LSFVEVGESSVEKGRVSEVIKRLGTGFELVDVDDGRVVPAIRGEGKSAQEGDEKQGKRKYCKFSPTPGRDTTVLIPRGLIMDELPTPESSRS